VQLLLPGRTDFQGTTTQADGSFAFDAPVAAATTALVVARDPGEAPRLGLARVDVTPGASAAPAGLTLEVPAPPVGRRLLGAGDSPPTYPALPTGLTYDTAMLQVLEANPAPGWAATVLSSGSLLIPTYSLAGFTQVTLLRAASTDHNQGLTLVGTPGHWPTPLAPPDLSGLAAAPSASGNLSWPAVAGATLYVARLYAADVPDPPLWEGLTTGTSLPIPAGVTGLQGGCTVQVDAWDVPGMDVYAVASVGAPRRFRIPAEPQAVNGRHSWARRAF